MPAPLDVDREQVRMLVLSVGVREAARQMGIKESTVMQWSARGKWLEHTRAQPLLPASMQPVIVSGVISPADALENTLREDGNATKTAGMKYARRAAEHAAKLAEESPDLALEQAANVKQVLQTAAIAGGWRDGETGGISVNLLLQQNFGSVS